MDDLLRDFVTEALETVENVDRELVRFEQEPNDQGILDHIFRLVHTIKGTCGFLGLPRLETLSHAAESMIGRLREGELVTTDAVTLILSTVDRLKLILRELETTAAEPTGDDQDLVIALERNGGAPESTIFELDDEEIGWDPVPALPPAPVAPAASAAIEARGERPASRQFEPAAEAPIPSKVDLAEVMPPSREVHAVRQAIQSASPGSPAQSIRVGLDTLESLMTMVSELVLTRNQLIEIARRSDNNDFKVPLQRLSSVTAELQERVMKTRMQPIGTAWQKLPRLVRDLCAELGKDIELVLSGAETELDRQVLELVKDPFTHLIRNAADHGIEPPDERRKKGKPGRATITVSAVHESGTITIEVSDDGRGLDTGRIAAKALERGLVSPAELDRMAPERIARFIFEPGFTTAGQLSHVSGRGIGMDVVRTNIELIGGSVDVRWRQDLGATFIIKIPLTLAIVAALIIETAGQRFAIPQMAVVELVQARGSSEHRLESINGTWLLRLRDTLLPVVRLSAVLGIEEPGSVHDAEEGFIAVIRLGKHQYGLIVDAVFHTEEIVVKPLSGLLRPLNVFSGNTILGDGAVILILDPNAILSRIGDTPVPVRAGPADPEVDRTRRPTEKSSVLVFRAGGGDLMAVPLASVTRLEEFDVASIETVGGHAVVQYRSELIRIVPAAPGMTLMSSGLQPVLVFSEGGRTAGIAVDEIVDIVEEHLDIHAAGRAPGVLGSAVIRGRATEVLDIAHMLPKAVPDWFHGSAQPHSSAPCRVLLVDAAPFFRGMLVTALKAAGYDVVAMADVDAAIGLLQRDSASIDVIVADVEAPGRNGLDLAEALAGDHGPGNMPVIGIASRPSAMVIERARDLRMADLVAKFDRQGLIAAIAEATAARELAA